MKNKHSFWQSIINFFARMKTGVILSVLYGAGILSFAISISLSPATIDEYRHLLSALPFLWWGLAGIVMIIRQEAYLFLRIEGMVAVIIGIIVLLLNLFLALIPLLVIIKQAYDP